MSLTHMDDLIREVRSNLRTMEEIVRSRCDHGTTLSYADVRLFRAARRFVAEANARLIPEGRRK